MIKKIVLVMIIGLVLTSCNHTGIENSDIKKLIESDKDNNRKSVFWDGEQAKIIDDERDDDTITEGRFGLRIMPDLVEKENWSIRIDTFNNKFNIISDTDDLYEISSFKSKSGLQVDCRVSKRDDYDSLITEYNKESEEFDTYDDLLKNSYGIERYKIFIEYPKASERISLIAIIESINKDCYEIKYSGYGNIADIFGLAYNTFDSFEMNIKEE